MKAYLKRQNDNGVATTGIFFFGTEEGTKTLGSLELSWKENQRSISCIPKGTYKVITTFSNRFKKSMWLLLDVPGRDGIRIHAANFSRQLEGCIALGMETVDIDSDGTLDVANSRKAIALARYYLGEEFELEIL